MYKPADQTIESLRKNPDYLFVARQSYDVYPGWAEEHVFRHIASESYWAASVHMDDDSSDYDMVKSWRQVYPETIIRYVSKSGLEE